MIYSGTVWHSFVRSRINTKMTSRVRKRAWTGTWWEPPDGWVAQLQDILNSMDVQWVFQLEDADSDGKVHTHIGLYFKNPVGMAFQENFDRTIHWEWKPWKVIKSYCSKVRTRIEGPWTNISNLKWRRTILSPLHGKTLYPWQQEIMDLVKEYADDRSVHWYWERIGCTGKSSLAKHLVMRKKCCLLNGSSKDCFCSLASMLESDDVDIVVFDLSRSQENRVSYTAIEGVKNGFFFSGKYESRHIVMNPPHVVVFANFPPDLNALSSDRWHVVNLCAGAGHGATAPRGV